MKLTLLVSLSLFLTYCKNKEKDSDEIIEQKSQEAKKATSQPEGVEGYFTDLSLVEVIELENSLLIRAPDGTVKNIDTNDRIAFFFFYNSIEESRINPSHRLISKTEVTPGGGFEAEIKKPEEQEALVLRIKLNSSDDKEISFEDPEPKKSAILTEDNVLKFIEFIKIDIYPILQRTLIGNYKFNKDKKIYILKGDETSCSLEGFQEFNQSQYRSETLFKYNAELHVDEISELVPCGE